MNIEELARYAREDVAYFSNGNKATRERWVVDRWLLARGEVTASVTAGADPPDFIVDGRGVEVVELLQPGRRRGDQYQAKVEAAELGLALHRKLASRKSVTAHGDQWVINSIVGKLKKYEPQASAYWSLLIYVNIGLADCISWHAVEARLAAIAPAFASIEVVFDAGPTPTARTLWLRGGVTGFQHTLPKATDVG